MQISFYIVESKGNDPYDFDHLRNAPLTFNDSAQRNAPSTSNTILNNSTFGNATSTSNNGNTPNNIGNAPFPHFIISLTFQGKRQKQKKTKTKVEKIKKYIFICFFVTVYVPTFFFSYNQFCLPRFNLLFS